MIDRKEIMGFSRDIRLSANIVEKDYVIGWLLAGISNHPNLSKSWVFKGGTCLKKCYFETYRFSEDLDFTLINSDIQNKDYLIKAFKNVAHWIYDATGIQIPEERIKIYPYKNPRGKISIQCRIYYRGPMQPGGDLPRIKIDLADDEIVVYNPINRDVYHPYSDKSLNGIQIQSYCYEELFAEKMRALTERLRPRDLYDIVHLFQNISPNHSKDMINKALLKKCEYKDISKPTMNIIKNKPERNELEIEWVNMLGHQVPELPPFEKFWEKLPDIFNWLYQ